MTPCELQVLYQEYRLCIARCQHCRRISILYFNLLAGFSPREFDGFCHNVLSTDFKSFSTTFPNGEPHIVLKTCHPDIQFSFNRHEFEQLQHALVEAYLLLQAQQALDINHNS